MVNSSFNIDSEFSKPGGESEFVMLNEKGMETNLNIISKKSQSTKDQKINAMGVKLPSFGQNA